MVKIMRSLAYLLGWSCPDSAGPAHERMHRRLAVRLGIGGTHGRPLCWRSLDVPSGSGGQSSPPRPPRAEVVLRLRSAAAPRRYAQDERPREIRSRSTTSTSRSVVDDTASGDILRDVLHVRDVRLAWVDERHATGRMHRLGAAPVPVGPAASRARPRWRASGCAWGWNGLAGNRRLPFEFRISRRRREC